EKAIPLMATFYIGGCLLVMFMNFSQIGNVFKEIITSAFDFSSMGGGLAGYGIIRSMKIGITRGIFTNEAGLGSAPIAHSCANAKSPSKQGFLGMFEVFFDTIVMCTMTGIVILLSSQYSNKNADIDGANLTLGAFQEFLGSFAGAFIAVSTIFFAVSTIISWSYYGSACVKFLTKSKTAEFVYRICYIMAIYIGATSTLSFVFAFSDLLNCLMMIPNLIGICAISSEVKKSLLDEFAKKNHNKE
ncbi:MAG: alanine:cation symporter family protein, partial [Oscillospiraceae bacterium]